MCLARRWKKRIHLFALYESEYLHALLSSTQANQSWSFEAGGVNVYRTPPLLNVLYVSFLSKADRYNGLSCGGCHGNSGESQAFNFSKASLTRENRDVLRKLCCITMSPRYNWSKLPCIRSRGHRFPGISDGSSPNKSTSYSDGVSVFSVMFIIASRGFSICPGWFRNHGHDGRLAWLSELGIFRTNTVPQGSHSMHELLHRNQVITAYSLQRHIEIAYTREWSLPGCYGGVYTYS